ncbi:MAG: hypothetical protein KJ077_10510 [Anaerolineae bacterium]|nr:hypothetical protein [Anaerolineae bacterium]
MLYVSLDDLKRYRNLKSLERDEDLLLTFLRAATRVVNQTCKRTFYPRRETLYYDYSRQNHQTARILDARVVVDTLRLRQDLLELIEVKTDNGDRTIALSDCFLKCGDSYNLQPYDRIALSLNTVSGFFGFVSTPQKAHHITGIWGYHERYTTEAWLDSLDTLADPVNASTRTFTVNDASGADDAGMSPRFKRYQLWRIDDEFIEPQVIDLAANTIEVRRGMFGSTAAAHLAGASIKIFQPMDDIVQVTKRIANWLYTQKDSATDNDRAIITQTGITVLPARLPGDIMMYLTPYMGGNEEYVS